MQTSLCITVCCKPVLIMYSCFVFCVIVFALLCVFYRSSLKNLSPQLEVLFYYNYGYDVLCPILSTNLCCCVELIKNHYYNKVSV